jgi:hypothetical protein
MPPSTPTQNHSVAHALFLQRWRTPALLALLFCALIILAVADRLLFASPSPDSATYRITAWSDADHCFLATPSASPGQIKRLYPLHMTRARGITDLPTWLLTQDITLQRAQSDQSPNLPPDALLIKGLSSPTQHGDLMARLIITGWLVPLPSQPLTDRERAFLQQHRYNTRTTSSKATKPRD